MGDLILQLAMRAKLIRPEGVVPESTENASVMQFGVFEVDLQAGELRKSGLRIKLQEQPFQILALLLERPGRVVTREELRQRLWPADTFVDFDHSLNSAVKKLRQALGDDSDNPRFIETLPRRGYRLIVPVTGAVPASEHPVDEIPPTATKRRKASHYGLLIAAVVIVALGALAVWKTIPRPRSAPRVLRFTQLTNDGQGKSGPMATDGSRIYFNEALPGQRILICSGVHQGWRGCSPLGAAQAAFRTRSISKDGTELLVASDDGSNSCSLWVQPVAGGSPRRVGTVRAVDARFGADGTSIIYGDGNDVYSVGPGRFFPSKTPHRRQHSICLPIFAGRTSLSIHPV